MNCKGVREEVEWSENGPLTDGNEAAERAPTRWRSARIGGEAAAKGTECAWREKKSAEKMQEKLSEKHVYRERMWSCWKKVDSVRK